MLFKDKIYLVAADVKEVLYQHGCGQDRAPEVLVTMTVHPANLMIRIQRTSLSVHSSVQP